MTSQLLYCCGNLTEACIRNSNITVVFANSSDANATYETFSIVMMGYLISLLVASGLFTNICCILLFRRCELWSYANFFIIALALWDMVLLVSAWLAYSLPSLVFQGRIAYSGHPVVLIYPYTYGMCNTAFTGCVWITVLISVDRLFAIRRPLLHRRYERKRIAIGSITTMSSLAVLYNIPRWFESHVVYCFDADTTVQPSVQLTDFGSIFGSGYFTGYRIICGLLFCSAGPCLLLFCFTYVMMRALRAADKTRTELLMTKHIESSIDSARKLTRCVSGTPIPERRRKVEKAADKLLICVLLKFLFCYSLPTTIDVLQKTLPENQFQGTAFSYVVDLSDFLVVLHSSTNFYVYLACGSRFRKTLVRRVTGKQRRREPAISRTPTPVVRTPRMRGSSLRQ